jgi:hypothetical protein
LQDANAVSLLSAGPPASTLPAEIGPTAWLIQQPCVERCPAARN